jgi:hypothetical protein
MKRPKLRRPRRDGLADPARGLADFLRGGDDATITMGRYRTAPVGPARTIGGRYFNMDVNDDPASAADHMDDRCRKAHAYLKLEVDDLKAQGMLYRVDDAAQVIERGEELDERSVIAQAVAKATRHLLGSREPWQPEPWPQPVPWQRYDDPSGVRAAYNRHLGGDAA